MIQPNASSIRFRARRLAPYDFIEVQSVDASFDAQAGEQRLSMTGVATLDWTNGNYQTDGTHVGHQADFRRDPGPDEDAPFSVPYPYFTRTRETILLPEGSGEFQLGTGMQVDQTAGGIEYRRHASIEDGVFTIEKTERSVVPEFPAEDAPAEQAALRMLADRPATLRMPSGYAYTGQDIAAVMADVPTTSSGYVRRAKFFINRDMRAEALLDYDKAVELDPGNVYAWSNRGITRVQVGDLTGAKSDLQKAEAIDPRFVQNYIGRGMLADAEGRPRDAVEAYSNALEREPDNQFATQHRAAAYAKHGQVEQALTGLSAAIERNPDAANAYFNRGRFYLDDGRFEEAIADFDRAIELDPSSEWPLANRGLARVWSKDFTAAAGDFDAVAKLNPENAVVWRGRGLMAQLKGGTRSGNCGLHQGA